MRILQLLNRVPWPLKDGGSLGFFNYTKGYHDAGCEVTVAAMNTSKHFVDMEQLPADVKKLADWRTVFVDNRVKPAAALANLFSARSYNVERFISPAYERLLRDILKEKTFDVIVFESIYAAPYLETVRRHSKALLVLRQHNVEHKIWETLTQETGNPIKKWYLGLLTQRLKKFEIAQLNRFDALTTVTENDLEDFREMGCAKPMLSAPVGMDFGRLAPDHSQLEVPSVFHLGSMEWMPNQEAVRWFIDEVWTQVSAKYPRLKFYVAGRGMPESFKQLQAPHVDMIGEVEDAVRFMQSKQIMIVPLFAGSGIRVKILEGMALGKTIVSTDLGAQGIACVDGEHLLIANTAAEFAEAIDKLVANPQLAEQLGSNARQLADTVYDNRKVIGRVLDFYQEQVQNKQ